MLTTTAILFPFQEYLKGALDRLANFFVAPLLLENGVERELEAIESEYQLNRQSDHSRLHQLWSTTCQNPKHPFSRFQWGNKTSLKVRTCKQLWMRQLLIIGLKTTIIIISKQEQKHQ